MERRDDEVLLGGVELVDRAGRTVGAPGDPRDRRAREATLAHDAERGVGELGLEIVAGRENNLFNVLFEFHLIDVAGIGLQSLQEQLLEHALVVTVPPELGVGEDLHHGHGEDGDPAREGRALGARLVERAVQVLVNEWLDLFVHGWNPSRGQKQMDARDVRGRPSASVSYTHLTLPTISS